MAGRDQICKKKKDLAGSIGFFVVRYASGGGGELEVTTFEDLGIAKGSLLRSNVTPVGN